ncbi:MAG TPA: lysophospholipid acyltransferase family protein [Polyangia bacterium]|jgi:1-acyl-sn-glycerol-3-phosphate acyltransferase
MVQKVNAWIRPLRQHYFRSEIVGLENLPKNEPSMLVGNHDGGYVFPDAICLGSFYYSARGTSGRRLYAMMHDFPFRIAPSLTEWLQRCGVVPASRRNSEKVLEAGHHILVYPGGSYEAFRRFRDRREITLGHRTGFVRQALIHRVPITPVVSVGAHETLIVLARGHELAKKLGLTRLRVDVLPFWLGLPFGIGWGPIPNLPLPSKIKLEVLEPVRLWKELDNPDPDDKEVLRQGLQLIRARMQDVAARLYSERRYPLIG